MKNSIIKSVLFIFLLGIAAFAKDGSKDKNNNIYRSLDQVAMTYLDINQISTQFYNNGISDIKPSGTAGLVYPQGSDKHACFTSGLLWGGLITGEATPRVGGTAFRTGLKPGAILSNGQAGDPSLAKYRIYRVRPDVNPNSQADLTSEAANENTSTAALLAQYLLDWNEWPADLGAPYTDVNSNGIYDPAVDIPGVPGANQTIWFVANDMDPDQSFFLYGALPIGIELQATYWAYNQTGALGSMYFRKYRLVNKGSQHNTVNNMYLSMWTDIDIGDPGDDFVGVDTVLSLQYTYNAKAGDSVYTPLPPPAVGFDFFQGPLVKGVGGQDLNHNGINDALDYGIFNGKKVGPGLINLPMTAAYYFVNGNSIIGDPPQGETNGSIQFYNFFQGKYGVGGAPFIDFKTGNVTTFALNGDPQLRTGWCDGLQLPAADRRQGSASGPFTFAPGDTQEVVVAEIVAGALPNVDRISAISLLKYYDAIAQLAYDNLFNLPVPPSPPIVEKIELDKQIVLDWGENPANIEATENYSHSGFKFQGYNVYQLPSASATIEQGIRIATFDIVDGIGKILDYYFDPNLGVVLKTVKQFGDDTGIKRYLDIRTDRLNGGASLVNGNNYYYAVTSYYFNPDPQAVPNNLENPAQIITVTPHIVPGSISTDYVGNIIHTGIADGGITVKVVDPFKIVNDPYQVFFTTRAEVRNENGDWVPSGIIKINGRNGNRPDTLSGSSIDISAVYGPQSGTINLNCSLSLVTTDNDLADGIKIVLPAGVTIINVPVFNTNKSVIIIPIIQGNTIILGDVNHSYSKNGPFTGGDKWSILVKGTLPIAANWTIYDDGYAGGPVDASGITTVTTIGKTDRLAKYWNLKDSTTQQIKLENQGIVNGVDLFPKRDDTPTDVGINAAPIVDGFQVNVNSSYSAPINFSNTKLTTTGNTILTHNSSTTTLDIQNYTIFLGTISSHATDNFGFGTTNINELQKDYILKFTGVWDSTNQIAGHTGQMVHFVKSGGQMATIFQATSLATHPLNPNPGTNAPFLIRIPFEVWSKDDNRQVNLMFRDRMQTETDNPFWAWNPVNRMHAIIVNSAYDNVNAITTTPGPLNALATWVLVFYGTNYTVGDQVEVDYANPIQIGSDKYTFTPTNVTGINGTNSAPLNFMLSQNYPNPFNPSTTIIYSVPRTSLVSLKIYDMLGREVRTLINEYKSPGSYNIVFNAHGLSSGVYFYRLTAGNYSDVKKLILIK